MFNQNNRLIELLEKDNTSQMTKEEYFEIIDLLDETAMRIYELMKEID